ncbi:putative colanic acid biosynthesis acetyltransferase WcaF [Pontibacter aydingkolensis]|uniref:WcaF family extracellular polysaccharide biosynthesis acetyltransferase n=1 Tax=Pontibacter aydingkolensis TaxID=1911536 RepID=A0ABS7CTL4_9BACT|nr:WcaF family extracellular polysaccharide biosynthesis acetyltransferase [Pontibacter aydingkolensis]MBW7467200.1 WcaF family extracellular polysaccharide biosynthesis acetyltransferase [Pontibacter aydingkolensis]
MPGQKYVDVKELGKVELSSYNNDWYDTKASSLKRFFWYFISVIFFINPLNPISFIKVILLRLFGAKVGKNVIIKPSVNIKYPWFLEIGDHVWIGEGVWVDNLTLVKIRDNVIISQGAMLLTGSHDYTKSSFNLDVGEILIEDGAWIGAKSIVCPNVTCFSHSVLAVGSIATTNLEAYTIYQGNPARAKRKRNINGEVI